MYVGALPPVSNQADWTFTDELVDEDTDEPVSLDGASIVFEVRDGSGSPQLTATTSNGKVAVIDEGVYQVSFTRAEMRGLCAGTYDVGCVCTVNGVALQFLIGTLPVLDGVVSV